MYTGEILKSEILPFKRENDGVVMTESIAVPQPSGYGSTIRESRFNYLNNSTVKSVRFVAASEEMSVYKSKALFYTFNEVNKEILLYNIDNGVAISEFEFAEGIKSREASSHSDNVREETIVESGLEFSVGSEEITILKVLVADDSHSHKMDKLRHKTKEEEQSDEKKMTESTMEASQTVVTSHDLTKFVDNHTEFHKLLQSTILPELTALQFLYTPVKVLGYEVEEKSNGASHRGSTTKKKNPFTDEEIHRGFEKIITNRMRLKESQRLPKRITIMRESEEEEEEKEQVEKNYKNIICKLAIQPEEVLLWDEAVEGGLLNMETNLSEAYFNNPGWHGEYKHCRHYGNEGVNKSVTLITVDVSKEEQKHEYELTYGSHFVPSPFMAMDRTTGRFFIYNNCNNKVLVFSKEPRRNGESDDKSKPLIEMDVRDQGIGRIDPSLYVIEGNEFSILLVIGGYRSKICKDRSSKNLVSRLEEETTAAPPVRTSVSGLANPRRSREGAIINDLLSEELIIPLDSIKVFKLEKKTVSTQPLFEIKMSEKRMNPIVFKYTHEPGIDEKGSAEDSEVENDSLINENAYEDEDEHQIHKKASKRQSNSNNSIEVRNTQKGCGEQSQENDLFKFTGEKAEESSMMVEKSSKSNRRVSEIKELEKKKYLCLFAGNSVNANHDYSSSNETCEILDLEMLKERVVRDAKETLLIQKNLTIRYQEDRGEHEAEYQEVMNELVESFEKGCIVRSQRFIYGEREYYILAHNKRRILKITEISLREREIIVSPSTYTLIDKKAGSSYHEEHSFV